MKYDEVLDKYIRKLGRDITAGEVVFDLRHLELPVKCSECQHYERGFCMRHSHMAKKDSDFCSWGERRET